MKYYKVFMGGGKYAVVRIHDETNRLGNIHAESISEAYADQVLAALRATEV